MRRQAQGHCVSSHGLTGRATRPAMVKTLHLLRHAKSSWKQPELADHDRPLSKRGRRAADAMAHRFAELDTPDFVLCSTALRTRQTLERISLKPAKVVLAEAIYGGGSRELMQLLSDLPASHAGRSGKWAE